jgi:outer membrane protein assembly factor BamE (lipoprotein component of BamABCDE complex)
MEICEVVSSIWQINESKHVPMKSYNKILTLENEMEAQRLSSILDQEGIPHVVRSYHDSVYDGIFQTVRGWGHLEAPEEHREKIRSIYDQMGE